MSHVAQHASQLSVRTACGQLVGPTVSRQGQARSLHSSALHEHHSTQQLLLGEYARVLGAVIHTQRNNMLMQVRACASRSLPQPEPHLEMWLLSTVERVRSNIP